MNSKRLVVTLSAIFFLFSVTSNAQNARDAQVWLTTVDRSALFAHQNDALHFSDVKSDAPAIEVNDMQQYQQIEGFGFALTGGSAQLLMQMSAERRAELLKQLFATKGDGIGVSYLRVSIGASDMNDHVYSYDDMPAGQSDPKLEKFSLAPDEATVIPALKEILAINPKIKILGSPWSAPAWMKTNDAVKGGELKPEFYEAYAQYLMKYVEGMKAEGIDITAITVENEPLNPKNTPSMVVFAQEEDELIGSTWGRHLKRRESRRRSRYTITIPTFRRIHYRSWPIRSRANTSTGTAFHLYGGDSSVLLEVHNQYPNKNLYLTEQSVGGRPGETMMSIAEPVSRVMIGATRNWARNVLLWNLAADPHAGPHTNNGGCTGCFGAITLDGDKVALNVAYYAMAHFSKFVRAGLGAHRIERVGAAFERRVSHAGGKGCAGCGKHRQLSQRHSRSTITGNSVKTTLPSESVATYVW